MPRFRSVLHEVSRDPHGGMGAAGVTVFIPMDDAASVMSISDRAEQLINPKTQKPYWTRKEPKEVTLKRLKETEKTEAKRMPR